MKTNLIPKDNEMDSQDEFGWIPKLSYKERMIGFGICALFGNFISKKAGYYLSWVSFP